MLKISFLIDIGTFSAIPIITKQFLYDNVVTQTLPTQTLLSSNDGDHYSISPEDHAKYYQLFLSYDVDSNGFLDGKEAVAIFNKSGLDKQTLRSSKQKLNVFLFPS